nr:MAG TPA: hypothetical protein [Crassvirales sp.]
MPISIDRHLEKYYLSLFPVSLQKRDKTITNFKNCYYGNN